MTPKIVDKEARRKEILHAAMREMAKVGIKNLRIEKIAEAAGIGKGTIYEYFSSKEEIFSASIVEFMQLTEDIQAKKMFKAVTPQEKLKAIIDAWIEACEHSDRDFLRLMIDVWAEGIRQDNPELKKTFDLKEIYNQYVELVAAIITDGINLGIFRKVDVRAAAGIYIASVDGLMIQWLLDCENIDLHKLAETLYDIFLTGILKK